MPIVNSENMMMKNIKNNEGISLIVALVFLFLSTLLGISALRTSLLNEKMTLNSIQREQALEAAEAALLEAELSIMDGAEAIIDAVVTTDLTLQTRTITAAALNCQATFNGSAGGICAPVEAQAPGTRDFDNWVDVVGGNNLNVWSTANRHIVYTADDLTDGDGYDLVTQPRYIIEFMGHVRNTSNGGESACTAPSIAWQLAEWPYCTLDPALFRITAFATTGNLDQTRVMLQTTYVAN